MSPSIKNTKKSLSTTVADAASVATSTRSRVQKYSQESTLLSASSSTSPSTSAATLKSKSKLSSSAAAVLLTSNVDNITTSSTSSSTPTLLYSSLLQQEEAELTIKTKVTAVQNVADARKVTRSTTSSSVSSSTSSSSSLSSSFPRFKIMSYQNIITLLTVLMCGLATVNGLKCYMCGQYNEGVGSITPCLNYSEQYAHLYLKECSKKSEKYCVKYVSELSIVRDCATECAEKEIWETQTYCCPEDGCNGSSSMEASVVVIMLPLVFYIINEVLNIVKQRR